MGAASSSRTARASSEASCAGRPARPRTVPGVAAGAALYSLTAAGYGSTGWRHRSAAHTAAGAANCRLTATPGAWLMRYARAAAQAAACAAHGLGLSPIGATPADLGPSAAPTDGQARHEDQTGNAKGYR